MNDLSALFDPDAYLPALVAVCRSPVSTEAPNNVRLVVAIADRDVATARAVLAALENNPPVGYALFQLTTAAMVVAAWANDRADFDDALDDWIAGRAAYRQSWRDDVLDVPEFASFLGDFDRDRLLLAPEPEEPVDLAMLRDPVSGIAKAVDENFEWLEQIIPDTAAATMATHYNVVHTNAHLREVTIGANNDWPHIIIAVDDDGGFVGSFLAH